MSFKRGLMATGVVMISYGGFPQHIVHQVMTKSQKDLAENLAKPTFSTKTTFEDIFLHTQKIEGQTDTIKVIEIYGKLFLEEINKQRTLANTEPLKMSPELNQSSQRFANYMKEKNSRGHMVDKKGTKDMGIDLSQYQVLLENVAKNSPRGSMETLVRGWLTLDQIQDSVLNIERTYPTHDNAIKSVYVDEFGCGFAFDERGFLYIVMQTGTKDPKKRKKYETIISKL